MQFNRQPMGWKPGGTQTPGGTRNGSLFQPKAFPWKDTTDAKESSVKPRPKADVDETTKRTYEVLQTTTVRAEPRIDAKMKTKKSRGARIWTREVTMNGWLKLEGEPGYMVTDMRGLEGVGQVAKCVEELGSLVVPEYQPQGICCLEVVHKSGATVHEKPSRQAPTIATRRLGEYVFAQSQSFDGWLHLASPDTGWVRIRDPQNGELL